MSVPQPQNALSGHCAGVHENTLYVFGNDGDLQSLPIEKNSTWSEENNGQTVNAPACAMAGNSLYVVGGASDSGDYMGLQRYSFEDKTWQTLTPLADVLQNRVNHSVAYLQESQSILVYAGSQDNAPSDLSSQTFLLATQPPYDIQSFTSNAPPANNPILVPWNTSHAVMVGGQTTSNQIWLFGPGQGWTQLTTELVAPLNSAARAEIVDGTDGSKVLQVYNLHTSPNTVQGIVLLDENGQPASTGRTVGASPSNKRKRDPTLSDWPSYNDTAAPTSTRTDCSIVRARDGLTIMAGGNEDNPLVMFNRDEHSWVDADRFFSSEQQVPLQSSSTGSPDSTSTPTDSTAPASTSDSAAGSGGMSSHDKMMRTLGITLGVLCGIAAIFVLVLLYLRWRKLQAKKKDGYLQEKNADGTARDPGRMSFQDRGASFMKEAGLSQQDLAPPPNRSQVDRSNDPHSSMAIITGKWGNGNKNNHGQKASFESTTALVKDNRFTENHEMMDIGDKPPLPGSTLAVPGAAAHDTSLDKETRTERKRSSGWSKYFAASQPTGPNGLSHIPSAYIKPSTLSADVESEYSSDTKSQRSRIPSSALVPPLDIDFTKTADGQRLSHVATGSPALVDSREDFARSGRAGVVSDGQKGQIVDSRDSRATSINSFDNRSTISSNVTSEYYQEIHTPWTPMSGDVTTRGRPTSSVYTNSVHGERKPSRGRSAGFFPGAGTSYKPSKAKLGLSHAAGPSSEWASPKAPAMMNRPTEARDSTAIFAGAHSRAVDVELTPPRKPLTGTMMNADLTPPRAPGLTGRPAEARDSTVTIFPGADYLDSPERKNNQAAPGAQQGPTNQTPANTDDMSWLNLGLNRTHS